MLTYYLLIDLRSLARENSATSGRYFRTNYIYSITHSLKKKILILLEKFKMKRKINWVRKKKEACNWDNIYSSI